MVPARPTKPASISGARWLHIPKTGGTSFRRVVLQWGCDTDESSEGEVRAAAEAILMANVSFMRSHCRGSFEFNGEDMWYHLPATLVHVRIKAAALFTMLREPLERTASGFAYGLFMCPELVRRVPDAHMNCSRPSLVLAYAACVRGCATRMLSGHTCGRGDMRHWKHSKIATVGQGSLPADIKAYSDARTTDDPGGLSDSSLSLLSELYDKLEPVSPRLLSALVARARYGPAFFGLTEVWARSVCTFVGTFPRRFGGEYNYSALMQNTRPSPHSACKAAALHVLRNASWRDEADAAIHDAAGARLKKLESRLHSNRRFLDCQRVLSGY